jgi:hypothetical protein
MSTTVKTKSSTIGGNVPSSLAVGELAVQLVDKRLFTANATQIFDALQNTTVDFAITNNAGASFRVGNTTVNCVTNSSSLTLANSTVTWSVVRPTAAQVSDGGYFPASDGTWKKPAGGSGSPGGSNTNIQYDDSGSFAGSNSFNFDKTTNTVTMQNEVLTGNLTVNSDFVSIGNSTVNAVINSLAFVVGNSSVTATLNSTALMFGASSIGANGYSYMPNGLIYQWGFGVATTGAGGAFTFPLTFPTAVFSVQVTAQGKALANDTFVNAVSTSGFNVITSTATTNVYYTAIGK